MVRDSPRQVSSFRALPMRSNGTTFISRLAFEGFRADQPGAGPEVDGARPDGIPGPGVPDAPRSRRRDGKPDLPLSKVPRTRIYTTMQPLHQKGLVQTLPETP